MQPDQLLLQSIVGILLRRVRGAKQERADRSRHKLIRVARWFEQWQRHRADEE